MKHKILIVDDEPDIIEGLRVALSDEPYEVLGASSAEEALEILRGRNADAIIAESSDEPLQRVMSTDVDVLGREIWRLMKQAERGEEQAPLDQPVVRQLELVV